MFPPGLLGPSASDSDVALWWVGCPIIIPRDITAAVAASSACKRAHDVGTRQGQCSVIAMATEGSGRERPTARCVHSVARATVSRTRLRTHLHPLDLANGPFQRLNVCAHVVQALQQPHPPRGGRVGLLQVCKGRHDSGQLLVVLPPPPRQRVPHRISRQPRVRRYSPPQGMGPLCPQGAVGSGGSVVLATWSSTCRSVSHHGSMQKVWWKTLILNRVSS